jgi:hypothetical protein
MIVLQGLILASVGLAVGAGAAVGLLRLMKSLLFEVSPLDPVTYAAVAAVVGRWPCVPVVGSCTTSVRIVGNWKLSRSGVMGSSRTLPIMLVIGRVPPPGRPRPVPTRLWAAKATGVYRLELGPAYA